MDLLKALKRTIIASAIVLLALGATVAMAAENVAELGHISASVTATLTLDELSALKFGNFATSVGGGTITLSPTGTRTSTGTDTLINGVPGIAAGSDQETASQAPGFYSIAADVPGDVYITFADSNGNIIDSNHPDNFVQLTGPGGNTKLTVKDFTFAEDDNTDGYSGTASSTNAVPAYGDKVAVAGTDVIRVGATLYDAGAAAAGRHVGTFYIMASY